MAAKSKKKNKSPPISQLPKEKKNDSPTNGDDSPASSASNSSNTASLIIAVLALLAGLKTPYIMSMYSNNTSSASALTPSRESPIEDAEKYNAVEVEEAEADRIEYHEYTPCSSENLANWLHEQPVTGLHVICFAYATGDDSKLQVKLYPNAAERGYEELTMQVAEASTNHYDALRESLTSRLDLNRNQHFRAGDKMNWQIYTTSGEWKNFNAADLAEEEKEQSVEALVKSGMVVLFEGGVFLWPGVRVGFERVVNVTSRIDVPSADLERQNLFTARDLEFLHPQDGKGSARKVILKTLSLVPLVLSVDHFLASDECDFIQQRAMPSMKSSGVSHNDQDKGSPASKWRTSSSTFLQWRPTEQLLNEIDRRVASLTRLPRDHQETAQVLRYNYLEKYNSHHDYFDSKIYRTSESTQRLIQGGRRNRLATVFWYLSDVKEGEGGETIFPRVNNGPSPRSMADCSVGLKVRPEKGKVIIFYSLLMNGDLDPYSLHGACPILDEEATKWAANKWIWNAPMHFVKK